MGLITRLRAVATVNPAEKANLLSASISVAMNCTAFGLMTAVPLVLIHAVLQTKTTELVDSLEMASVKFLNSDHRAARRSCAGYLSFQPAKGIQPCIRRDRHARG